jgi:hypothetical protein
MLKDGPIASMASPDGEIEALVTDVVARDRPIGALTSRLVRVRCIHCAMPVRGGDDRCWSCDLDPTGALEPTEPQAPQPGQAAVPSVLRRRALFVVEAVLVVLIVAAGSVLLIAPADGRGVRGLAARLHGDAWGRSGLDGATAEFPVPPVRSTTVARPGAAPAPVLVASAPGLRVELRAVSVDESTGVAVQDVVGAYAADAGLRVVREGPRTVAGGPGWDAVLEDEHGLTRLRAVVVGGRAYVMAVTGPDAAFERFTASFRREG